MFPVKEGKELRGDGVRGEKRKPVAITAHFHLNVLLCPIFPEENDLTASYLVLPT